MNGNRIAMLAAVAAITGIGGVSTSVPVDPFADDVSPRRPDRARFVVRGEVIKLHNPPGSCDPRVRDDRLTRRKAARRLRATRGRR